MGLPAQDLDHYTPLRWTGEIPADLLGKTSEKYAQQVAELGTSNDKKAQASRERFLLQSSYFLDNFLQSGKILFNDPLSGYLNRLKDYLLRDQPELQEKIRIYTVRSTHVNAFATNQGIILVNAGLLAHLHTEAELALVLCHEIQHYIRQHPIDNYVNTDRLRNGKVFGESEEDQILEKCQYSREQEMEADSAGLSLYLKTNYSLKATESVFDMLSYAPYHFENIAWDKSFFETPDLRFPAAYVKDSLQPFEIDEDEPDSLSTHPSIGKRRRALKEMVKDLSDEGRTEYLFGEEEFKSMRNLARFEQTSYYLAHRRYEAAIYCAYLLLKDFPDNFYLKKSIAQALYGLARYKNESDFLDVHVRHSRVEGPSQQMYYFFGQMNAPALNALAISWTWDLISEHPADPVLDTIGQALLVDYFLFHRAEADSMSKGAAPQGYFDAFANWTPPVADTTQPKTPPESRIGNMEAAQDAADFPDDFYRYAFAHLMDRPAFAASYAAGKQESERRKALPEPVELSARQYRRNALRGEHLGIDKVIVVAPLFVVMDESGETPVNHLASEAQKEVYTGYLKELSGRLDLQCQIVDPAGLQKDHIDAFNDFVVAYDYFGEVASDEDAVPMVNMHAVAGKALAAKYGTRYFAWMGTVATKREGLLFLTYVFDITENRTLMSQMRYCKGKGTPTRLRGQIYDALFQIKSKPRRTR